MPFFQNHQSRWSSAILSELKRQASLFRKSQSPRIDNHQGSMLIEVLVAAVVISIVGSAIASSFLFQQREVKALDEKMIAMDVETSTKNILLSNVYCECLLRNKTFDTTNLANPLGAAPILSLPAGFVQPVPAAPAACTPLAAPAFPEIVPPVGTSIGQSRIKTGSIDLSNAVDQGGGQYSATINVGFDTSGAIRSIRPMTTPLTITIDTANGTPSARPIVGCGAQAPPTTALVYYNPNTMGPGTSLNPPPISCQTGTAIVEYGGKLINTGSDNTGIIGLRINGAMVSTRKMGGQVSKANLDKPPETGYGLWMGPCAGALNLELLFWRDWSGPNFREGFLRVSFQ